MTVGMPLAPFPITYRELWLPPAIADHTILPGSVEGGHQLALTGAQGRTTADGVRGYGDVASNINCGANAVDNAQAKYWVSLRFRPSVDWTLGDGDQYLWGKVNDATHFMQLRLDSASGDLVFHKREGLVGTEFTMAISSPAGDGIWHAGVWYHCLCSISNPAGARMKVNDADLQTNVDVNPTPAAGDLCFLDNDDPGAGTGFIGVEADIFCGDDDLTGAEETRLYRGLPPVGNVVHEYLLDEGRGVTAYDRGSGADNGTLDTSPTWAFGQVQQPVLSLDCINDRAVSSAGVDISGDFTLVWAAKIKAAYAPAVFSPGTLLVQMRVDGPNMLQFYNDTTQGMTFNLSGGGVAGNLYNLFRPSIDDYLIFIGTSTLAGGGIKAFVNGILVGSATGVGAVSGAAAITYLGMDSGVTWFDISKTLLVALIEGAFTQQQARAYSRYLKNVFNLPITI